VQTFTKNQTLETFHVIENTPASTTISFEYSLDRGSTWQSIAPGDTFPRDTRTRSFQYRATLTTSDPTRTPTITSVTLTHTPVPANNTATRVGQRVAQTNEQIAALRSIESPAAREILQEQYPEYFENPDAPLAKQKAALILLQEVIRLLGELAIMRQETVSTTPAAIPDEAL